MNGNLKKKCIFASLVKSLSMALFRYFYLYFFFCLNIGECAHSNKAIKLKAKRTEIKHPFASDDGYFFYTVCMFVEFTM